MNALTLEQVKEDSSLMIDFINFFFNFFPYDYQTRFLEACITQTRVAGKWSRQSGKSQTVSVYTTLRCILEPTTVIIVAPTQNQSTEMFNKIRDLINSNPDVAALIDKQTQTELKFKNGSRIISLPCGPEGRTIRGYTCDILIIEEAGVMDDDIVNSVLVPMIASKGDKGQIIKIGTPLLRNHFYRSCFEDPRYTVINVVWQDGVRVGQYDAQFIEEQKAELTDIQFKTEYEADFIDAGMMFFPSQLLKECSLVYNMMPEF